MPKSTEEEEKKEENIHITAQCLACSPRQKSADGRILAFGIATVILLVAVICGGLCYSLYEMTNKYLDSLAAATVCKEDGFQLRRALDHSEGKLGVYEEYLTDRRNDILKKALLEYVQRERVNPSEVSLDKFQQWILASPSTASGGYNGMGGPSPILKQRH